LQSVTRRDGGLDAIRGIAALVVVNYHSSLGFLPTHMALFTGLPVNPQEAFWTHFWFVAFNGPAAVTLFFVLSGFVLTYGCFATRRPRILLRTAVKRYPRLAGPVLAACLIAWLLFKLGLHDNARAAALTGSNWLVAFGHDPGPSFESALKQGLWRTLLYGNVNYNTSLWTMRLELLGSFVCLAAAAVLLRILVLSRLLAIVAGIAATVLLRKLPLDISAFMAGVTLSVAVAGARLPRLPLPVGLALCALSLYFYGYMGPEGDYAWLASIMPAWLPPYLTVFCSVLLIFTVESCARIRAALSSSPFLRWLGEISFALYLIHYLVILSAGSATRVALDGWGTGIAAAGAFVAVFTVSLAAATPLSWYDQWLMAKLNEMADRLVPRRPAPATPAAPKPETPGLDPTSPGGHLHAPPGAQSV
jgi:peptidoglycan/LPS O-acetylase OafA/YrhL